MRFRAVAEPLSLRQLRAELAVFLDAVGAPDDLRFDVTLAVSEAANNVLQHAFRHRAAPGTLVVVATVKDAMIRVVVSDDGAGLSPRPDSPGAGLGLPLMASLSDDLAIGRARSGGTEVALSWRLAAGA
jgi:serine/threonine-protein kinase RsbW